MLLKTGDVIELKEGMTIYASIPKHFVYENKRGDWELCHTDVTLGKQFDYLCGKYIVIGTSYDGGGTAMGPHDIYPDGHHVFCVKADNRDIKVDFYQTGSFTAMITEDEIQPVGQAKLDWTLNIELENACSSSAPPSED